MQTFISPDSSVYFYLNSKFKDLDEVYTELKHLLKKFKNQQKIRFLIDSEALISKTNLKTKLQNFVDIQNINFQIQDYITSFFVLDKVQANQALTELNFRLKQAKLEIIPVQTGLDLEIFTNFQLNSFGVKFSPESSQPKALASKQAKILKYSKQIQTDPNLDLFLIKNSDQEFLGAFGLVILDNEIQLHSVAGLAQGLRLQKSAKLCGLIKACLELFVKSERYQKQKKLTLSSSKTKLVKKYQELGFKPDLERFGLLFLNHSS